MTTIVPAILPRSYDELADKLDTVAAAARSGHVQTVQIDVCDGAYVPNRTWPYLKGVATKDGEPIDQIFADIVSQEKALPHWEDVDFEFDLMCRNAYEKIPDFISAGAARIIVHLHSMTAEELETVVKDFGKHSEELGPFDVELGVAIMPSDSPAILAAIADKIHFVQVMGIGHIGFQGQAFDSRAVELVRGLRAAYPQLSCAVDGGVNMDTARQLVEAGADSLVIGSALFGNGDFLGTLKGFQAL